MKARRGLPLVLFLALGTAGALAVTEAPADDPPVTVTEQVTTTVERAIRGCAVTCQYRHRRQNGSNSRKRGRTITVLRHSLRSQVRLGGHGLVRGFLCIHRFEGSWRAATGNGYHGGLQMDRSFMRTYGREFLEAWGTADRWPVFVQLTVAMRAYLSGRGFHPWPNTARMCGLL